MDASGTVKRVSKSSFEWIIPNLRKYLQHEGDSIRSDVFRQPESNWYLFLCLASENTIEIYLLRKDHGPTKTITYTIKIKGRTDIVEMTKTNYSCSKDAPPGYPIILINEQFLHSSPVICCITFSRPQPVAGREFVTCAVQTEVANSVNEKENPKKEDWSSLDTKGFSLLSERMKELLIKGGDHDVTICVQNKKFRAHRSILSARSPVFAAMLSNDTKENNTGTISIEDCDPESFDEFLLYVYSGRTENLTSSNALQIYYAANKYDFPVLKERCVSVLKTSLSVESICDVVLLAAKHQEKELLDVATEFFARNVKKILVTVGWQKFLAQNPVEANELYIKSMEILHPQN